MGSTKIRGYVVGPALLVAVALGEMGASFAAGSQTQAAGRPSDVESVVTPKAPALGSGSEQALPGGLAAAAPQRGSTSTQSIASTSTEPAVAALTAAAENLPDDLKPRDLWHHPQSFFGLCLVIAAVAKIYIYLKQLEVYKRQAALMAEQKNISKEQERTSAIQSKIQLEQNSFQKRLPSILERARLSFSGELGIKYNVEENDVEWIVEVVWKNFGRTPAIEVEIDHTMVTLPADEDFDPSMHLRDYGGLNQFPVPPGGSARPSIFLVRDSTLREDARKAVTDYAIARVRYRDVIEDAIETSLHESLICFTLTRNSESDVRDLRANFLGSVCRET